MRSTAAEARLDELDDKITQLLLFTVEQIKGTAVNVEDLKGKEEANCYNSNTATPSIQDGNENFPGWLPLNINNQRTFSFDLQQLKAVRDNARSLIGNQIYKNVIKHYQNHVVGDGLTYTLIKKDKGEDPKETAKERVDLKVQQMIANWEKFEEKNHFNDRLCNVVERSMRDGEAPLRLFDEAGCPAIRFIEPSFITPLTRQGTSKPTEYETRYGVKTKAGDVETIVAYCYNGVLDQAEVASDGYIKAEKVIFIKRNTDFDFPRGIPDFWPVSDNIRRFEKILNNTSVLIQIQSAIALVRKHKGTTGAKVANFVRNQSDGKSRTDVETGKTVTARKFRAGMILDASDTTDYQFPAAAVHTENFTKGAEQELIQIALNFVLPLAWLLAAEPVEPLGMGSPTVKNFIREQNDLYTHVEDIFWRVQKLMGVDSDKVKEDYELIISGPLLGIGKPEAEAKRLQILQQCAAVSPQTIAHTFGYKYAVERANTIRHRNSLQPGEVAPGDLGNTDPGNNSGVDNKKNNTSKQDNAPGGNQ